MYRFALLLVLLVGCAQDAEWVTVDLPARVWVDPAMSDVQLARTEHAIRYWTERVRGVVPAVEQVDARGAALHYTVGAPGPQDCGIVIVLEAPEREQSAADTASNEGCVTKIRLRPTTPDSFVATHLRHELGHAFMGPEHNRDMRNLMGYEGCGIGLTATQLDGVRVRM